MDNQLNPASCLDILQKVNYTLSGKLKETEIIQILLDQTNLALQAQGAALDLIGPEEKHLHPVKVIGVAGQLHDPDTQPSISAMEQQVLNGKPAITSM